MEQSVFSYGIIAFLLGTLGIGVWASQQIKGDSVNFLVAGRGLALPLAAATLMAQSVDSNATLGNTDLSSAFGFWAGAALPLGLALCLLLTGLFLAKPMNRMGLITIPDFYRVKYGRTVEVIAACIMSVSFSFLLAGNLVAGGYMFENFLGTSYVGGITLLAALVFAYTVSGGLFAVAYTDFIQIIIAVVGAWAMLAFVLVNFGLTVDPGMGPGALEQLTSPAAGAAVNWASLIALGFGNMVAIDFMARIFAADSPETAQKACFVASAGTLAIGIPFSIIALGANGILSQAGITPDGPVLYAMLKGVVPPLLGLLVLAAILSASLSTADGAILGTSSVLAHNVLGIRHATAHGAGGDKLLLITRLMAVVITVLGVVLGLKVPQTGVLLLLAFDMSFAGLVVPLIGGLFWAKATRQGALACIAVGSLSRLLMFSLMPTMFGVDNTLLYFPNGLFTADFDGFPTMISPLLGLVAFVAVSLLTHKPLTAERQRDKVLDEVRSL
ncbi:MULTISPECIES: sodium:solute symporter [Cyanophyceae]|uniref:sodium:solute symporter family transporter n=1 Tax=Cyanophyceae TaxID=3028117 RepID=UPI0016880CBC|nr:MULTISPECIES: sodium:solute symporter [Cyanophyceae]MBD1916592.1 sodium:solute symporter [Phormidium sp. FACHB-77]MBD2032159.1 sodium:solute symporter [Phormidium sp. FACHB-322]MBD2053039.1 sodium:solute symporter [Leptolyngbya sp. FACHB-60]